jgi:hypothetical protein
MTCAGAEGIEMFGFAGAAGLATGLACADTPAGLAGAAAAAPAVSSFFPMPIFSRILLKSPMTYIPFISLV